MNSLYGKVFGVDRNGIVSDLKMIEYFDKVFLMVLKYVE